MYNFNQSNQITAALANVTDTVNGIYCKDRVTEFLCSYFFPQCDNNTKIVPICEPSCNEYLLTGICVIHLSSVLNILNTSDYHIMPVDKLLDDDCSPPYNITFSDNCNNLTSRYIATIDGVKLAVYLLVILEINRTNK